ncbi:MAG: hypothetical protein HKO93_06210, partial [Flavobacteriales bacterium]|nr:hypothetical protein [Flavobacteriales bacterium]
MSLTRITFILLCSAVGLVSQGQFNTPSVDGSIDLGEYGDILDGTNQITSAGITWHCTWDNTNLYFAIQGAAINEGALIYLDFDQNIPVNGGGPSGGSLTWPTGDYDRTRLEYPFNSDVVLYVKDSYSEFRL